MAAMSTVPLYGKIYKKGENSLRIGGRGGEVAISDPTSPLYKASVSFEENGLPNSEKARKFILFQIDNAGEIKKDQNGNPRILTVKPTSDTTKIIRGYVTLLPSESKKEALPFVVTRPALRANKKHSNILTLYIDSDEDGVADRFPIYFIKHLKYRNYTLPRKFGAKGFYFKKARLPVITTFANIVIDDNWKIIKVKVEEPPNVSIDMKAPSRTKLDDVNSKVSVIAVGPPVTVDAVSSLRANAPDSFTGTLTVPYYADALSALGVSTTDLQLYKIKKNKETKKREFISATDDLSVNGDDTISANGTLPFTTYQAVVVSDTSMTVPEILDVKVVPENNGKVSVKYKLADAKKKNHSDVRIEYRKNPTTDPDAGWTVITTTTGVKPKAGTFRTTEWDTLSDTATENFSGHVQVKVAPEYEITTGEKIDGAGRVSETFRIDNSGVTISAPGNFHATVTNFSENEISGGIETNPPEVALSWDSPSGDVAGYNIYRKARYRAGIDNTFTIIKSIDDPATTEFTDSKDNGTLSSSFYEAVYRITAFDSLGNESKFSNDKKVESIVLQQ